MIRIAIVLFVLSQIVAGAYIGIPAGIEIAKQMGYKL